MNLQLEVQRVVEDDGIPGAMQFQSWAEAALNGRLDQAELVVRIVDREESRQLNREYRGKDKPTNVLSFPFEAPAVVESDLLGDLVVCAPVVNEEALAQNKPLQAHWAHLLVHGVLHLLGFDHINEQEAEVMEGLEVEILEALGFPDPYQSEREL
ncbi:rRNA maturation RNase YbeY [Sedimenticola sp.]|uniref:rRNA maturation RNase YbeY n=1 Tax=Sedimenticola sp. TaxID=1940285 RepID=UPI0025891148|nr:rRNA maturation RNase YbeY [Sedimenticola sp.]MCW8902553.1 rRNA maturation RNase YbeY [Sedimenticola sp.]